MAGSLLENYSIIGWSTVDEQDDRKPFADWLIHSKRVHQNDLGTQKIMWLVRAAGHLLDSGTGSWNFFFLTENIKRMRQQDYSYRPKFIYFL